MSLHKLSLLPDINSYTAADGMGGLRAQLDGGAGKYRKSYQNAPATVTCQWTCNRDEYLYLRTFYNLHEYGTKPFTMELILHTPFLVEHEARFIPDTFRLNSVKGEVHVVRAQLEVVPNAPDAAYDEGFVVSYEAFGLEASDAFTDLERLVNISFPAAAGV